MYTIHFLTGESTIVVYYHCWITWIALLLTGGSSGTKKDAGVIDVMDYGMGEWEVLNHYSLGKTDVVQSEVTVPDIKSIDLKPDDNTFIVYASFFL